MSILVPLRVERQGTAAIIEGTLLLMAIHSLRSEKHTSNVQYTIQSINTILQACRRYHRA